MDSADPVVTQKVTLREMAVLADHDLSNALSMKYARVAWGRPNNETEDREVVVRRGLLDLLNLIASYPTAVREALRSARAKQEFPPPG